MTQCEGAQPATAAADSRQWRSRVNRSRKRPTASPKQPGFLKLRARGNDTVGRRAARNSSYRTSQWLGRKNCEHRGCREDGGGDREDRS
jgi:hypothetical protein